MTNAKLMLIFCAAFTYVVQLVETKFHLQKQRKSSDVLLTALHDELQSKPVGLEWRATCFHLECTHKGDRKEVKHTEVFLVLAKTLL